MKDYMLWLKASQTVLMVRKQVGRNTGHSGRVNLSGSELTDLDLDIGDTIEIDVADTKEIAHALINSKESDQFLIVTPV
ncbi:hypothetical protein [Halalkalicoccus jeotgali]|uniref:Uncharacterized protein n=1 Tax=Halalkalicoccus jeotgali (strain DSM 18796 / CECT 7217 / JCM 14584 / KCTC 4019 / B3) TaxID=795797 RepID=D8JCQ4_HALJB|nr:hypothetical protein [Halalkalicoccus jeotgali]ADJ16799.1 hypothetical protein HacjB3_17283 [Halalkalicoccus jeotgali B3]ADJ17234.1 hypothetical protein HacjB3_19488 [Halalkalicoccus jeotgali B3]ELY41674.1 hypothetical protein C497_00255 [Halalkalicoccus jeotgali B3]